MKKRKLPALLLSFAMLMTMTVPAYAEDAPEPEKEDTVVALPYGFKGMPVGYVPDSKDTALKTKARADVSSLAGLTPGVDYADREIVYLADSEEDARTIAEAYNAKLFKYQYGVATAYLKGGATVAQAVEVGASASYKMPLVSPNYITCLEEPVDEDVIVPEMSANDPEAPEDDGDAAVATHIEWISSMENPDPALIPGYTFYKKDPADPEAKGTRTNGYQWMHDTIDTYGAWAVTMGDPDIVVAVIDTGINDQHEELKGHSQNLTDVVDYTVLEQKTDENGNPVYDENGDPVMETVVYTPFDESGHGTHVAGIIAAAANNGAGGAGIAPGVTLIGLPVFVQSGSRGVSYDEMLLSALMYVAGYNMDGTKGEPRADVANMSLGGNKYNAVMEQAVNALYKNGVTICAAMGNQLSNGAHYPACYEHTIAVCSTDRDDMRSFFSNYGAWADISAPGSSIFSTWNGHFKVNDQFIAEDHNDWYVVYSGTSMATPVVTGACALYMSAVGHVDPDTMKSVLQKNATKMSEKGVGAGLVNVAAMMPDTATLAGVDKPILTKYDSEKNTYSEIGESVTIKGLDTIIPDVPKGAAAKEILLTFDGKDPTYKNGKAGKNCYVYDVGESEGFMDKAVSDKFTLKAAYVGLKGTLSKVVSVNVTLVRETTDPLTYVSVNGPFYVAVGKTVQYTGKVTTNGNFADKGIEWSIPDAPAGVTIDKNGKLKVGSKVSKGTTFFVRADAKADSNAYSETLVTVISPITGVKVEFEKDSLNEAVNAPVKDKKGNYKSVRMYTVDLPETSDTEENVLSLDPVLEGFDSSLPADYDVTSNNNDVVFPFGGQLIAGGKPGKAKITIISKDGCGKKATFEVNAVVPASGLDLVPAHSQTVITYGKSAQLNAAIGRGYGDPTIKDLSWDYNAYTVYLDNNGNDYKEDMTQAFKDKKLITIDKKGKITANKKAESVVEALPAEKTINGVKYSKVYSKVDVTATTTDGTALSAGYSYDLSMPTLVLYLAWPDSSIFTISGGNVIYASMPVDENGYAKYFSVIRFEIIAAGLKNNNKKGSYLYESSNPMSGSVTFADYDSERDAAVFDVYVTKPGYAKITITANDGSGKKIELHIVTYGVMVS